MIIHVNWEIGIITDEYREEEIMEKVKHLNVKIKIKGLDELEDKLYMLGYKFERIKSILKDSERLIEEINEMDLVVDVDRDLEGGLYGEGN